MASGCAERRVRPACSRKESAVTFSWIGREIIVHQFRKTSSPIFTRRNPETGRLSICSRRYWSSGVAALDLQAAPDGSLGIYGLVNVF